jgi:hypothetical protein
MELYISKFISINNAFNDIRVTDLFKNQLKKLLKLNLLE